MPNLITDLWLPVTRLSGAADTVRASDLTDGYADDPIVALAFGRPDWSAAVTEWLIGVHAVARPVADVSDWLSLWRAPPTPDQMAEATAPLAFAFDLLGDGPRCFQDRDPLSDAAVLPIYQLRIDAPGANTVKQNQDFFVRRRTSDDTLSWPDAAAALTTLQTYAPSGGAGHRTSMRGGGPLTTLIRPRRMVRGRAVTPLYDLVVANVPRGAGQPPLDERLFPWLGQTRLSAKGEVTTPEHAHPLQAFFGMPRRLRLDGSEAGITGFRSVARGVNYDGWTHPLSPYYADKAGNLLPLHPRAGVPTFRDWPSVWGEGADRRAAACVSAFDPLFEREEIAFDIAAWGYDLDNAKARAWTELRVPHLADDDALEDAAEMVRAASETAASLRFAAKRVLYGQLRAKGEGTEVYLPDTVPRDACAEKASELELTLEPCLRRLIESLRGTDVDAVVGQKIAWFDLLRRAALEIFDRTAEVASASAGDVPLIVAARGGLTAAFLPKKKVAAAMGIGPALEVRTKERRAA